MFNISPDAAKHCVLCKNRHDFVTEGLVQIFINIYYMQFIYRKMLTHMAVKWWIRLASILLVRLACILHDIKNIPTMKTQKLTHLLTERQRKRERKNERKKVHSLPIKGVLFHILPGILVWTDEQVSKLFSISTISHFHCSIFNNFIKHNQSAFLYHGCQETVTISNIRRYYDFKVEG